MSDIVERLREGVWGRARRADAVIHANMQDGADEIERLRTQILLLEATGAEAADEIERLRDQIYESIPKHQANELQREIDRLRAEAARLREALSDIASGPPVDLVMRGLLEEGCEYLSEVAQKALAAKEPGHE